MEEKKVWWEGLDQPCLESSRDGPCSSGKRVESNWKSKQDDRPGWGFTDARSRSVFSLSRGQDQQQQELFLTAKASHKFAAVSRF